MKKPKRVRLRNQPEGPSRKELKRRFQQELYEANLKFKAKDIGDDVLTAKLVRDIGDMQTGRYFGLAHTSTGAVILDGEELEIRQ